MSRKAIKKVETIYSQENVTSFKRDKKTGYYKLITQKITREQESNTVKCDPKIESDDFYKISNKDLYDYSFEYQDIDGSIQKIYFKKIDSD